MKKLKLKIKNCGYIIIVMITWFGFWILSFGFTTLVVGCGQQTTETTTTTLPSGTVSISGYLYSGTIKTSSIRSSAAGVRIMGQAVDPIANYSVVAVGTVDNKVYFPDTKTATTDGSFSILVPSGESFYLEIIDDKKKFVAPVSFGASGESVYMAITPEAGGGAINLGQLVYESAKGAVAPTLEISASKLDEDSTAKKKSGEGFVPVGTGLNLGRGTGEAAFTGTLKDKVDEDNDGLPDVVDVDDDGDGKVDGLDSAPRLSGRVEVKVTGVNNTNTFSNLPQNYENYPTYNNNGQLNTSLINVATQSNLAIEVVMTSGTLPSIFSDVRIVEGPAWIEMATISGGPDYPSTGTSWKDEGYKLYKNTSTNNDRWQVHVTPNGTPEAGDVLKFQLTDASTGAKTYFVSTLTYVFKDIPRLVAYSYLDGTTTVTKEGADLKLATYTAGVSGTSNVFSYKGSTITFHWTAPKDDLGNYLTGMEYYLDGINYYNYKGTGSTESTGSLKVTPTMITSVTFESLNVVTFTPTTESFDYFKVDVKAQSPLSGGGNASQLINFKKI